MHQSKLLSVIGGIVHGYSDRTDGDMRLTSAREGFVRRIGADVGSLVWPEQVHGTTVVELVGNERGEVKNCDGLMYKKTHGANPVLAVFAADCVPLLLVNSKVNIIASVHAGWKGTLNNILRTVAASVEDNGGRMRDVYVSIGPHIGMCCYDVPAKRAAAFQKVFGRDPKIAAKIGKKWHLDLGYAVLVQLKTLGVPDDHIDAPVKCTSCQAETFFSFRKDAREHFGKIMGIIGFAS